MKKTISMVLIIIMVINLFIFVPGNSIHTNAAVVTDSETGLKFDASIGTITGYTGSPKTIIIPSTINGVTVTKIGNNAFNACTTLASISIPNSVTSMGERVFYRCSSLICITIPNSVTSIGGECFYSCSSLTNIIISDHLTSIGQNMFSSCILLNNVTIPNSVTSIGEWAFYSCSSLTSITIPNSVTTIGDNCFNRCSRLANITISGNLTSIGQYIFSNCISLNNVIIPNSITNIGYYAFSNCASLTNILIPSSISSINMFSFYNCNILSSIEVDESNPYYSSENGIVYNKDKTTLIYCPQGKGGRVEILNSVTSIGGYAFRECALLTEIIIPDSVTAINWGAFYNCTSLTELNILDSVISIGQDTFRGCSLLNSVIIGNSLVSIGQGAFLDCISLTDIVLPDSVTSIGKYTFKGCSSLVSIKMPINITSIAEESFRDCPSLLSITIPYGVLSIGRVAFSNCTQLNTISIPNSVTSIGEYAFYNCTKLNSIVIPDGVTQLAVQIFGNCSSLTSLIIPNSVTIIRDSVFSNCTSLTNIIIPANVSNISGTALLGCTSLTSIDVDGANLNYISENGILFNKTKTTIVIYPKGKMGDYIIPDGITNFGMVFNGCINLTSIVIPDNITIIPDYAFSGCSSLKTVTTGNNITSIKDSAFSNCTSLISFTIPTKVVSIGIYAFRNCTSLTSIIIPSNVKTLGSNAFSQCSGLASVEIIDGGLTAIDGFMFYDCSSLSSVSIPNSVTSIGSDVFSNCFSLTSISIPNNITSIGSNAFGGCRNLTAVSLPNGLKKIDISAFFGCINLASISLPSSLTIIGNGAFSDCRSLTSVTIPNGVTYLEGTTFARCTNLKSITLPINLVGISDGCFSQCSSLETILIPETVTTIGFSAFYGCSSLTTIIIPKKVTKIDQSTFSHCSNLTSVIIPNGVTFIGLKAFANCDSIESITIPKSVTTFERNDIFFECGKFIKISGCDQSNAQIFAESISVPFEIIPAPIITIGDYDGTTLTNKDIIVSATIDKGILNYQSHTFIENESFDFIATDDVGNTTTKTVVITNIDKVPPIITIGEYSTQFTNNSITVTASTNEGTLNAISHTFTQNGTFEFIATDNVGNISKVIVTISNIVDNIMVIDLIDKLSDTITYEDEEEILEARIAYDLLNTNQKLLVTNYNKLLEAEGIIIELDTDFVFDKTTGTIIGYNGTATILTIPTRIEGVTVKTIGERAFEGNNTLLSIKIPNSVLEIKDFAFSQTSISSIFIPSTITNVGVGMLSGSAVPSPVFIENGKTLIYVPDTYYGYEIPSTVTKISGGAFYMCSDVTGVYIPSSVTNIGDYAFAGCNSMNRISIPNSVTTIGNGILLGTSILNPVIIQNGKTLIYVPHNYSSYLIPNGVTKIGGMAFFWCIYLTSITIPSSVQTIGYGAFGYCYSLEQVILPESVTTIEERAFSECSSLRLIHIPESVTIFENDIFADSDNAMIMGIENSAAEDYARINSIPFLININNEYIFDIINGSIIAYLGGNTSITIPSQMNGVTVKTIGANAFEDCSINSITIPNTVTKIDNYAFYNCTNLSVVNIPSSVTDIGSEVFVNTPWLNNYPSNFVIINGILLQYKGNESIVTIPNNVVTIGDWAFYENTSITKVIIPNSVKTIGVGAFDSCYFLATISMTNSVTSIETWAFNYTAWIKNRQNEFAILNGFLLRYNGTDTTVIIPDSVKEISIWAFSGCENITNIIIPKSVNVIGTGAFMGCSSLESIIIPKGVTSIEPDTFMDCFALKSITIPDSVNFILEDAFFSCTDLVIYCEKDSYAKNYAEGNGITFVEVDPPIITISDYNLHLTNQSITVFTYTSGGTLNATSHTFTENGSFDFITTDDFGNVITKTVTITNIDKTAPIVYGVTNVASYNTNKEIMFIDGTATLNGVSFTSGSTVSIEGTYTLVVTDLAGNITIVAFKIDKTAPKITIRSDDSLFLTSENIYVSASVNEGTLFEASHIFTENGSYQFIAIDAAGNIATKTVTITNIEKVLPIISGVVDGGIYDVVVSIEFNKGTAMLNGTPYVKGDIIRTNGDYHLIVTDIDGNSSSLNFTIQTPYSYSDGKITGIAPNTRLTDFKRNFYQMSNETINLFNENSIEITDYDALIGTGMYMNINGRAYTIIISGDVNGDGIVALNDLVSVRDVLLEKTQLDGIYKSAGDMYGEGAITLNDLVGIMAIISESDTTNQNLYVAFTNTKLTGKTLTNIQPGSTVNSFLNGVIIENNTRLEFKKGDVVLSGSDKIGTGTVINVYVNGVKCGFYSIVIYGDVNGDGDINFNDIIIIKDCLYEFCSLGGEYFQAGDLYGEEDITLNDFVGIMSHLTGSIINQNQ